MNSRSAASPRGKLIAFEGIDGSGKSTQLAMLAHALRERGADVVTTREPTAGVHGQRIRAMARSGARVDAREELAWFVEDRREHVSQVIEPALAAGRIVLTDRYFLSSVAYQGARGLDPPAILAASEAEFPVPDLAILFEMRPELGLERVRTRGGASEPAFEELAYLERVAAVFSTLDRPYLVRIAGDGPPEAIHRRVVQQLESRLLLPSATR